MQKKNLNKEQAIQKLKHYCGYQERCHSEVRQKLWDLGVLKSDHDEVIATLIEEDYLNEERFAKQFAGGKFRLKTWGKRKIEQALKEKQVSGYIIKVAMKELGEEDYLKTAEHLAIKKYNLLKGEHHLVRKKKTMNYLLQKGYEPGMVSGILKTLTPKP